jgi:hypothetical protein
MYRQVQAPEAELSVKTTQPPVCNLWVWEQHYCDITRKGQVKSAKFGGQVWKRAALGPAKVQMSYTFLAHSATDSCVFLFWVLG